VSPEVPEALEVALQVIDILEAIGVRYHVGGSYASSFHGIPRQTQDIDLVVALAADHVSRLVDALGSDYYCSEEAVREAIREHGSFNLIHLGTAIKFDLFVLGDEPFDREEFSRHRLECVDATSGRRAFIKTAEDILLRKLEWFKLGGEVSDRQWNDLLGLVRVQGETLDLAYLRKWAAALHVEKILDRLLAD
jgi:hypothetical protein